MFQYTNQGIVFSIKVIPKSSRNGIVGWENEELKIRLAAVPEKGEANTELIRFLADFFKIGKSKIEIMRGQTSRHKRICLKGISEEEIKEKLKGFD